MKMNFTLDYADHRLTCRVLVALCGRSGCCGRPLTRLLNSRLGGRLPGHRP